MYTARLKLKERYRKRFARLQPAGRVHHDDLWLAGLIVYESMREKARKEVDNTRAKK